MEVEKGSSARKPKLVLIEVKHARKWKRGWERTLGELAGSAGVKVDRALGLYMGDSVYHLGGVEVMPVARFLDDLFAGKIF